MLTNSDLRQIEERGSSKATVERQLEAFRKGFPWMKIVGPATPERGIKVLSESEAKAATEYYDKASVAGRCKFVSPDSAAAQIDFSKQITANDIGLVAYLHGIIDTDTVCELVEFHSAWLWNTISSLLKANPDWDLFYMHSHPIDWFYHGWLSDLNGDKGPERKALAEKMERHIYTVEDRLLGNLMEIMGDETLMCVCSDHGATPLGPILNTAHALREAGLCSYEPKKSENFWDIYEETEGFNYKLDVSKSVAVPQRYMFVYVNLKSKYPDGIVEDADYEDVRQKIIDALLDYRHPDTGERPVLIAVRREDAQVFGMGGADLVAKRRKEE